MSQNIDLEELATNGQRLVCANVSAEAVDGLMKVTCTGQHGSVLAIESVGSIRVTADSEGTVFQLVLYVRKSRHCITLVTPAFTIGCPFIAPYPACLLATPNGVRVRFSTDDVAVDQQCRDALILAQFRGVSVDMGGVEVFTNQVRGGQL